MMTRIWIVKNLILFFKKKWDFLKKNGIYLGAKKYILRGNDFCVYI